MAKPLSSLLNNDPAADPAKGQVARLGMKRKD